MWHPSSKGWCIRLSAGSYPSRVDSTAIITLARCCVCDAGERMWFARPSAERHGRGDAFCRVFFFSDVIGSLWLFGSLLTRDWPQVLVCSSELPPSFHRSLIVNCMYFTASPQSAWRWWFRLTSWPPLQHAVQEWCVSGCSVGYCKESL